MGLFEVPNISKKRKFVDVQGQNLSEKYNIERDQSQSQKSHVLNIYWTSVVDRNPRKPLIGKMWKKLS